MTSMFLTTDSIIRVYAKLGQELLSVSLALNNKNPGGISLAAGRKLYDAAHKAVADNAWFTIENISLAVHRISLMLQPNKIERWLSAYPELNSREITTHKVLVIMAGNIPLVGIHDMLCVLASGHRVMAKLSSQDKHLPEAFTGLLCEIEPSLTGNIAFAEGPAGNFDVVIATGSNNSARYFAHYFGQYPHIIRHGRTSAAILNGNETADELKAVGDDIFTYYGLGCRNVSLIWLPDKYDIRQFANTWKAYEYLTGNEKYANNYLYNKAIYIVNKIPHIDTGFCLLTEDHRLFSPVSVIHFQYYSHADMLLQYFDLHRNDIQCIVTSASQITIDIPTVKAGTSQQPELWDYADGIDTMAFLISL